MFENGIGYSQIPFGVLKIDRVYLVGHGGRSYFTSFYFLFKIVHGNIGPKIPVQIYNYGIYPLEAVEQGGHMVIMFYLCSWEGMVQTKFLLYKILSKNPPINVGVGHLVGIVVSCCPSKFCGARNIVK